MESYITSDICRFSANLYPLHSVLNCPDFTICVDIFQNVGLLDRLDRLTAFDIDMQP